MTKKLIYLEDDTALAFVTSRSLSQKGYEVDHVESLESFKQQFEQHDYHFALLDLKIGTDNSLELLQDIEKLQQIPTVVLSGYGTIRTAVKAMKLGAVNFLTKPASINEIITAFDESSLNTNIESNQEIARPSLKNVEWETIQAALDENNGNISATARQLKMHRRTLQRKLQKRHIEFD
jgi:two-component system response regulator RegA